MCVSITHATSPDHWVRKCVCAFDFSFLLLLSVSHFICAGAPGTYSSTIGAKSCPQVLAGYFAATAGATSEFGEDKCPGDNWCAAGTSTPTPCSTGSDAKAGSIKCICKPGYTSNNGESTNIPCTPCQAHAYSNSMDDI